MGCEQLQTLLLGATAKTLPDRQALQQQRLRKQNAKNTMTSKVITIFNQLQLRPLVCMARPTNPFLRSLAKKLVDICLMPPDSASGSTSTSSWLWSEETLPTYWPVCKFYLILSLPFFTCF